MNGTPFPYMNNPNHYGQINPYNQMPPQPIENEIMKLKTEIEKINKRLYALENKDKKDYLKKDEGLYMM